MLLKYFYDEKIAHASYMVGCQATGEALVVDPGREVAPYLTAAKDNGLRIIGATETHIHADFICGTRELAEQTGATLYLSDEGDENWKYDFAPDYSSRLVKDGDTFMVGNIKFEVMHTPGHTPEHVSFMVTDTAGADEPMGIFTGDFVFVGDVGRPDLLEEAAGIKGTSEPGARQMFRSLNRFKTLPDYLQVWPAHGAGSACGKALGAIPSSTVGYEKRFNWALMETDEERFVKALLAGQPEPPTYFAMMKKLNKSTRNVLTDGLALPDELDVEQLKASLDQGATVVDTRPAGAFAAGHIAGTLNIPRNNDFTNWAGWLLSYNDPFYLIVDPAHLPQTVRDLAAIGLDNIGGYVDPSAVEIWPEALQTYSETTPTDIADKIATGKVTVIDVRARSEWDEGHLPQANHLMLGHLSKHIADIPADKPIVVQCRSGARSAIGASILQAHGLTNVLNLKGGYLAWVAAGLPVEQTAG